MFPFGSELRPPNVQLISRERKGGRRIGSAALAVVLQNAIASASLAQECPSKIEQQHNYGTESFNTSSRVYGAANVNVYETCVENKGSKDLWINWFIPGPRSYVLQGDALTSPRAHVSRKTESLEGCLEYGGTAALTRASFLGHANDAVAADRERAEGCEAVQRIMYASAYEFSEFELPIEAYVPSDRDDPSGTMLHFTGRIAVERREGETYATTIDYSLEPVPSAIRGEPKDIDRFVGAIYVPHWLPEPR